MGCAMPARQQILEMADAAEREGRWLLRDQLREIAAGLPDAQEEIPAEVFIWQAADYAARPSAARHRTWPYPS